MSSFTLRTGTDGCATIMFGSSAAGVIAAKSFSGSYEGFAYRLALIACVPVVPMTSV